MPAFIANSELVWTVNGRLHEARHGDVRISAEAPRFLSSRWTVRAASDLALPVDATLYIARAGGDHGYWNNLPLRLRGAFGDTYFAYCSVPAVAPVLVGDETLRAIAAHDRADATDPAEAYTASERHPTVAIHLRAGTIETRTAVDATYERVIADQLAIHAAFAADMAAFVEQWRATAEAVGGQLVSRWPVVVTVPRDFGLVSIALRWSTSERAGASAYIELAVDARGAPMWAMEREPAPIPNGTTIGGEVFLVTGDVPIDVTSLAPLVSRSGLVAITVRRTMVIRTSRSTPDAALLNRLMGLLGQLSGPSAPYR